MRRASGVLGLPTCNPVVRSKVDVPEVDETFGTFFSFCGPLDGCT
ncbi:hypothetical protein SEA_FINKLE_35 [Gordonia phage Finkle]|uniref:Uncharacterized protein n=1 Tax=Gordonia phage Finkle TaxID=2926099 RepID=A0A9E7NHM8_9CAUD|nr:hypothetical protein QEH33_gp35 [Gordonia phage Finkle]UTN92998.1 hypothetical protein SEA_FINKLE_35 [Gordonia phage Finkle]